MNKNLKHKVLMILDERRNVPSGVIKVADEIKNGSNSDINYEVLNLDIVINRKINSYDKKKNDENFYIRLYKKLKIYLKQIMLLVNELLSNDFKSIIFHNGGIPGSLLITISLLISNLLKPYSRKIMVIHNYPRKSSNFKIKIFNLFTKLSIKYFANKVVSVSYDCSLVLSDFLKKNVLTIHNGINTKLELKNKKRSLYKRLLFVGEMDKRKGLDTLLKAIQNKVFNEKKIHIIIVGSGDKSYKDNFIRACKKSNYLFSYLGFRKDIDKLMLNCDILIVPSIYNESFGMVLLEAYRAKIPIVSTNIGGMKEVILENKSALVFKPNDWEGLGKNVNAIITKKDLKNKLITLGYELLLSKFSSKIMADKYGELI